jgi:hypothetical protein
MIVGERIVEVAGKKQGASNVNGLSINISLKEVRVKGEMVELDYEYTANYESKDASAPLGEMTIKGTIVAQEDKKLAKEIADEWKKSQKLPDAYAEIMLPAIHYSGSANGTLVARVMSLPAPLVQPKVKVEKN